MTQYGWDGEGDVPYHLEVVSWMDRLHGQLKLITSKEKMKLEEKK